MPTPQELLDAIHLINIQSAWDPESISKERVALIKLNKQKLKAAKQSLRQQQEIIKKQYDGRNKTEAAIEKKMLLPYSLIDQLTTLLENYLNDLQHANEFDRPLPDRPIFGQIFYGSVEYGSYIIADANDLTRIQQEQLQKGRDLKHVCNDLEQKRDQIKINLTDEAKIISVSKSVNAQKGFANFLGTLLFLELAGMIYGFKAFVENSGPVSLPIIVGVLGVFIITFLLFISVSASFTRLVNKILNPYLAALKDIEIFNAQISRNQEAHNQAKRFYEEAKAGLIRIKAQERT